MSHMNPKIFLVGGAVRDILLGREPKDRDFVVVGADVPWMLNRGFKQVGQSFPVFLHPDSGEEFALARRERKTAPGYHGFEFEFGPDVTLEDDLLRRDLTINAMAFDETTKQLFDPFGGQHDLAQGVLRHTSEAFAEDPLRVLRVARFASRYSFTVAAETVDLCKDLVNAGEIDALSADRIWTELEKLLSEDRPSIGLQFLKQVGAANTNRLVHLMRIDVFSALDWPHDVEPILNLREKIFLNLRLEELTKEEIEALRVPIHALRDSKFMERSKRLVLSDLTASGVVAFFDQHREELKSGKLAETVELFVKLENGNVPQEIMNKFSKVAQAVDALLRLDFTELVKGLQPATIKSFVAKTKADVVTKAIA